MRVDALRNRERLLNAARDVFVEQGVEVALEDIAQRAGVGIATLYRRFPDRVALMRAVALHVLAQVAAGGSGRAGRPRGRPATMHDQQTEPSDGRPGRQPGHADPDGRDQVSQRCPAR